MLKEFELKSLAYRRNFLTQIASINRFSYDKNNYNYVKVH